MIFLSSRFLKTIKFLVTSIFVLFFIALTINSAITNSGIATKIFNKILEYKFGNDILGKSVIVENVKCVSSGLKINCSLRKISLAQGNDGAYDDVYKLDKNATLDNFQDKTNNRGNNKDDSKDDSKNDSQGNREILKNQNPFSNPRVIIPKINVIINLGDILSFRKKVLKISLDYNDLQSVEMQDFIKSIVGEDFTDGDFDKISDLSEKKASLSEKKSALSEKNSISEKKSIDRLSHIEKSLNHFASYLRKADFILNISNKNGVHNEISRHAITFSVLKHNQSGTEFMIGIYSNDKDDKPINEYSAKLFITPIGSTKSDKNHLKVNLKIDHIPHNLLLYFLKEFDLADNIRDIVGHSGLIADFIIENGAADSDQVLIKFTASVDNTNAKIKFANYEKVLGNSVEYKMPRAMIFSGGLTYNNFDNITKVTDIWLKTGGYLIKGGISYNHNNTEFISRFKGRLDFFDTDLLKYWPQGIATEFRKEVSSYLSRGYFDIIDISINSNISSLINRSGKKAVSPNKVSVLIHGRDMMLSLIDGRSSLEISNFILSINDNQLRLTAKNALLDGICPLRNFDARYGRLDLANKSYSMNVNADTTTNLEVAKKVFDNYASYYDSAYGSGSTSDSSNKTSFVFSLFENDEVDIGISIDTSSNQNDGMQTATFVTKRANLKPLFQEWLGFRNIASGSAKDSSESLSEFSRVSFDNMKILLSLETGDLDVVSDVGIDGKKVSSFSYTTVVDQNLVNTVVDQSTVNQNNDQNNVDQNKNNKSNNDIPELSRISSYLSKNDEDKLDKLFTKSQKSVAESIKPSFQMIIRNTASLVEVIKDKWGSIPFGIADVLSDFNNATITFFNSEHDYIDLFKISFNGSFSNAVSANNNFLEVYGYIDEKNGTVAISDFYIDIDSILKGRMSSLRVGDSEIIDDLKNKHGRYLVLDKYNANVSYIANQNSNVTNNQSSNAVNGESSNVIHNQNSNVINVDANKLDWSDFSKILDKVLKWMSSSDTGFFTTSTPLQFSFLIREMLFDNDNYLKDLKIDIKYSNDKYSNGIKNIFITSFLGEDKGYLSLFYDGSVIALTLNHFGYILDGLNSNNKVRGDIIDLRAKDNGEAFVGSILLKGFSFRDMPIISTILKIVSISSNLLNVKELLRKPHLFFDIGYCTFKYDYKGDGMIEINNCLAYGKTLIIEGIGKVDLKGRKFKFVGNITPVHAVSTMLGIFKKVLFNKVLKLKKVVNLTIIKDGDKALEMSVKPLLAVLSI